MNQKCVMLVEDDQGLREALYDTLELGGYKVVVCECAETAISRINEVKVDLIVSDIQMTGMSGIQLLQVVRNKFPNLPVILMTAYAQIDDAVTAMQSGATDYIAKPFEPDVLLNLIARYAPAQSEDGFKPVVGDESSQRLLQLAQRVAKTDATVMVLGPSGSGKEVLGRYIHEQSSRADGPFVAINCAAIPENMLEATLFGYEKGAFTGALQTSIGKFEQAQQGTIMLDEVTEMDLGLQAKLLRVLQEREVERLGSRKTIKLDVRVIATSNRDLMQSVQNGLFREDLYYRLNVFPLHWLPLNERVGDIVPLAEHLVERHALRQGYRIPDISFAARQKLLLHPWPGNVRELENVIQRALILCDGNLITEHELMLDNHIHDIEIASSAESEPQSSDLLGQELKHQENQIILEMLISCNGKRKDVAEKLGISPRTLRYKLAKMREMGIDLPA
ncbi:sigma-54-dependent transcriptional regulator [Planctobacterium marinum]|uniref:sigma-54-dependent transcriptional regulator n=1 Tax=Planctobacterium marinum TaxID=1631968 RepID=UPI001E5BD1D3|nr:sigma-54 dependent transcriptional regulator [Planctobacterium marinum]MCC2606209.1 sigma-54 dependent transcriptional regulator [Planctobacterium marinum]